jgi:hypothetical protein
MSKDVNWITARITEARKLHPTVTEAVSTQIEELLRGQLSERELSTAKLSKVAKALIADMVPPSQKTGANQ